MFGIECSGDGSGFKEYEIMDAEFRGHVRFKDFCKYVKAHEAGKNFGDKDSSFSSSEDMNEMIREMWKEIDTKHICFLPADEVCEKWKSSLAMSGED